MQHAMIDAPPLSEVHHVIDPDLALVEASIGGDIAAFEELVRRHSHSMIRVADQVTRNLDDAQEAVQEAFLKAYQNLRQFRGRSKFSTWMTRIALNESIEILRKQKRNASREISLDYRDSRTDNLPMQTVDWHPDPERIYGQVELQRILRSALSGLRPALRVVFVLRDVEGLSIAETATALDLAPGTVKVRLHRARLELRERLSRYFQRSAVRTDRSRARYSPCQFTW